jgi:ABC-2 type transport system ATP-binding protein
LNDIIIAADGLSKSYMASRRLRSLNLAVPRGSICGFLGRNGAGKTTTLKLLLGCCGRMREDSAVWRAGRFGGVFDCGAAAYGLCQRGQGTLPFHDVDQTIRFTRPFFPGWRRDLEEKYLDLFQLPRKKAVPKLSKGMRTQLMLLLAMARGAELLMMDEPTSGLDPAMTEDVLQILADLAASDGTTIFFSSHQLAEVEQICDRVCIIDQGQVVIDGVLDDLKSQYRRILLVFDGMPPRELAGLPGSIICASAAARHRCWPMGMWMAWWNARARTGADIGGSAPVTLKELFLDHVRGE